jgi:glycosyltransferase involved in cell wall biosynthesis
VKIIEAAAHAKAVVSTPVGAEGLHFCDGREIVLRRRPAELAQACVDLLRDPPAAQRLGAAALHKARTLYERSAITGQLREVFRSGLLPQAIQRIPA